jgi:septum formation protein
VGVPFTVRPSDVEELSQGDPREVAIQNALLKAHSARRVGPGADGSAETILAVDTLVALDGHIYGKPAHEAAARATLRALGGRTHRVLSGLTLLDVDSEQNVVGEQTLLASTEVSFRELDETLLERYLATGEWRERAGGYAIQGAGAVLVRRIEGDYENVVGLPLAALLDLRPALLAPSC